MTARPLPPFRILALLLVLAGCGVAERVERVVDARRDATPHEAYVASLRAAGLAQTALGRDWLEAGARAATDPQRVPLPYREEGFLSADDPAAVGLRVALRRGQVLTVRATFEAGEPARVFVDLFRVPEDPTEPLRPLARVDSLTDGMVYEPYRDGDYVLRVQPELLRGGRYRVVLTLDPSLAFPVQGKDPGAIGSGFGAPRDGGVRAHHGVDIFAPRGTPVLAASDGRVIWVRDERRGQNLYYAHLDRQLVTPGTLVRTGDTLGLVGNTGNARTTPPHLHFGVYARGPQDPDPYLRRPRGVLPDLPEAPERLGRWARVSREGEALRGGPGHGAETLRTLPRDTPVRVLAGSGGWWRVRLPDGATGWMAMTAAEPAEGALRETVLAGASVVRTEPTVDAPVVEPLAPGSRVRVFGTFAGFLWVMGPEGRAGWVSAAD